MANLSLSTTKKELFGHLDALDETDDILKQYFVETDIFRKMKGKENFLLLIGEKGTGKSAIMKMCMLTAKENDYLVVDIQRPPVNEDATLNEKINEWKNYLAKELVNVIGARGNSTAVKVLGIAGDTIGQIVENKYGVDYTSIKTKILDMLVEAAQIYIYIDDLDTGYKGTKAQNESIIALFTAIREMIRVNRQLVFRVTLRTDVYDNIRQVDESSDKIQDIKHVLSIKNHEILAMLTKRVVTFLDNDSISHGFENSTQQDMLKRMEMIFDPIFNGYGKWAYSPTHHVLMALTRRRPRDLFVLCGLAWDNAVKNMRVKIVTEDIQSVFQEYSNERLRDVISEYNHEFRSIEYLRTLLLGLKLSSNDKRSGSRPNIYTKDELIKKVSTITERKRITWVTGKNATDVELAQFLYKANVVIGRVDKEEKVHRIYYMEKPNLISGISDGGYKLELHPAYRWAIENTTDDILKYVDAEAD